MTVLIQEDQHLKSFLLALKTTETKRQYSRNLKLFFDLGFESILSLSEQANLFVKKSKRENFGTKTRVERKGKKHNPR